MFRLDADVKVYLHREAIDFRKSINGLAVLVEQSMGLDPFAGAAYVFRNRRCNRIKLLIYNRTGFWLLMRSAWSKIVSCGHDARKRCWN